MVFQFLSVWLCRSYSLLVVVLVVMFLGLVASMLLVVAQQKGEDTSHTGTDNVNKGGEVFHFLTVLTVLTVLNILTVLP